MSKEAYLGDLGPQKLVKNLKNERFFIHFGFSNVCDLKMMSAEFFFLISLTNL